MGCSTTAAWRPITLGLLTFLLPSSRGVFFFAIPYTFTYRLLAGSAGRGIFIFLCQRMAPMGLDSPIAGRVGTQHFFPRIATILFDSFRASPARTREFAGAARPRTPGFTFGRPKVNRKTAKTKVLESFVLTSLYQIWDISASNQVFVI